MCPGGGTVDARDLKSLDASRAGSNPALGTTYNGNGDGYGDGDGVEI